MSDILKKLVESLRINLVVFVENDFHLLTNVGLLVSKILSVNSIDRGLLNDELTAKGFPQFIGLISEFQKQFELLPTNSDFMPLFVSGRVSAYLDNLGAPAAACTAAFVEIEDAVGELSDLEFHNILFKYGIGATPENYDIIFEELKKVNPQLSLRYYQQLVPAEIEEFSDDLSKAVDAHGNRTYLCIIDKMLGDEKMEGVRIIQSLPDISRQTGTTPISFIFSSQPEEKDMNFVEDYYSREINKNEGNLINKITHALAQCAYAKIFDKLRAILKVSADDAATIVIKNHKNINHILKKAQEEGLTPFEALYSWFQLALDYIAHKRITADYKTIFGLSEFLDDEYLPSYTIEEVMDKELLELNTFEIFDYDVNKKHLPIVSGDVFEKDGKYYVIVGQECDLLVREKTNKRNAQVIELVEAEFITNAKDDRKLTFTYDDNSKVIFIQNFISSDRQRGCLKISLSEYKIANYEIFDTCMFCLDGSCKISLSEKLPIGLDTVLPKRKDEYYKQLQAKFSSVSTIYLANPEVIEHFAYTDFSNFDYTQEISSKALNFEFKRLCRIKGNFKYFINKAFFDFRSRVDLNLIANTSDIYVLQKFKIGVPGKLGVPFNLRVYREQGKSLIKLDELLNNTPDEFKDAVSKFTAEISIPPKGNPEYSISDNNQVWSITLKYKIIRPGKEEPLSKDKVTLKKLLQAREITEKKMTFLDDSSEVSIMKEDGITYDEFDVEIFRRGVQIYHEGLKRIHLEGEKIIVTNAPEPEESVKGDITPDKPVHEEEEK